MGCPPTKYTLHHLYSFQLCEKTAVKARQLDALRFQRPLRGYRPDPALWSAAMPDRTLIRTASLPGALLQHPHPNMSTTITVGAELPSLPPKMHNDVVNPPPRKHRKQPRSP